MKLKSSLLGFFLERQNELGMLKFLSLIGEMKDDKGKVSAITSRTKIQVLVDKHMVKNLKRRNKELNNSILHLNSRCYSKLSTYETDIIIKKKNIEA